jgi:DNA-binding GntR family transcriptional regulator
MVVPRPSLVVVSSLREQIYDYLKEAMQLGALEPGATLDLKALEQEIGISRTPLRDALLQLAAEGFVEILPRRGVRVVALTIERIRDHYEILAALEGTALRNGAAKITDECVNSMDALNQAMRRALAKDDFDEFYALNLQFHECWLELSDNQELKRTVRILKQRLYDFPRNPGFIKEWEENSTKEHDQIVAFLRAGDVNAAADYVRDVHWSFTVQEAYIRRYYAAISERKNGD